MKTLQVFEPALCCPTGICGVNVDPELLRMSSVVNALKQNGIALERFNLKSNPDAFVKNETVSAFLNEHGVSKLPIAVLDDKIVVEGRYPTNEEIASFLEVDASKLTSESNNAGFTINKINGVSKEEKPKSSCCCGGSSSCC